MIPENSKDENVKDSVSKHMNTCGWCKCVPGRVVELWVVNQKRWGRWLIVGIRCVGIQIVAVHFRAVVHSFQQVKSGVDVVKPT